MYKPFSDLSTPEILAFTIRESPETTTRLLSHFLTIRDLAIATEEEIQSAAKGIGPVKARQILSALELGKRLYTAPIKQKTIIRSSVDAAKLLMNDMRYLDREHFRVIHLNTKHHVINVETVSIGSLDNCLIHPRECFKNAVRWSSAALILVHNHPSSDSKPSQEDIDITKRLVEAGNLLGIPVLDHIVIGDGVFVSLKEQGLM